MTERALVTPVGTAVDIQSEFYACRRLYGFGGANWWQCSERPMSVSRSIEWLGRPKGGGIEFIGERILITPAQAWYRWLVNTRYIIGHGWWSSWRFEDD